MTWPVAPTPGPAGVVWRFDDFELDTARYELRGGGTVIRVEPQVFEAMTSRFKAARRALGDDGESQRYLRTVRGRGYQFVGTLIEPAREVPEPLPEVELAPLRQHIAFTRALDGVRLAYAVVGEGPPLVRAANWMMPLGCDIESPVWRHWVQALSAEHTFIRYDERGCGLSDWEAKDFTFSDWVADLESVVDALGLSWPREVRCPTLIMHSREDHRGFLFARKLMFGRFRSIRFNQFVDLGGAEFCCVTLVSEAAIFSVGVASVRVWVRFWSAIATPSWMRCRVWRRRSTCWPACHGCAVDGISPWPAGHTTDS